MSAIGFLDISGDPGFKFPNSTRCLVAALVLFDKADVPDSYHRQITRELSLPLTHEFHFRREWLINKEYFFRNLSRVEFKVRYLLARKDVLLSPTFEHNPLKLKTEATMLPLHLTWNGRRLVDLIMCMEDIDPTALRGDDVYWHTQINLPPVRDKVNHVWEGHAKNYKGLQFADMIAGGIRVAKEKGNYSYFNYFQGNIEHEYEIP